MVKLQTFILTKKTCLQEIQITYIYIVINNNIFSFFLFQSRSSNNQQLNDDGSSWANQNSNGKDIDLNHVNNVPDNVKAEAEVRNILSPQKPVNLLPQVPVNSSGFRKLSENEEHDCEIIGMSFCQRTLFAPLSIIKNTLNNYVTTIFCYVINKI